MPMCSRPSREYYEAVHVVRRDTPEDIQGILNEPASGMWLAYLKDEVVGCVVLRRLASIPRTSECKRLYVRPAVRGNHIADKLLDAQEEFARSQGVEWAHLDSYDDLKPSITLYERRDTSGANGQRQSQVTPFMRERIL